MQSKRYSSAFGQTAANDAQKRQKTPLIVVKSSLFIASRRLTRDFRKKQRKHLAEYIMAELLQEASSIITSTPVKTAITITIVLLMIRRSLQILFPLHF